MEAHRRGAGWRIGQTLLAVACLAGCGRTESTPPPGGPAADEAVPSRPSADADLTGPNGSATCPDADVPEPTLPHNVVILMGDGMGPRHIEAARAYAGAPLALDEMTGPVLYDTAPYGGGITDSAASATALATGQRTLNGALGIDPSGARLETLLELAQRLGKKTGLVTNSYVLDASPMAFATHVPDRYMGAEIAAQLVLESAPDIVMGGWVPAEALAPAPPLEDLATRAGYWVGRAASELPSAPPSVPLFGAFGSSSASPSWPSWDLGLPPETLQTPAMDIPPLEAMAALALDRFDGASAGFFLFVESELCDTIGHNSGADPTLAAELIPPAVLELDRAIATVLDWVSSKSSFDDTLVLVVSDHETGLYVASGTDPLAGRFGTTGHSDVPVPAYARGPGEERLARVRHTTDLHALIVDGPMLADVAEACAATK